MPEFNILLHIYTELGYWVQVVSAAVFTIVVMSAGRYKLKKFYQFPIRFVAIVLMFVSINFALSMLSLVFRPVAGVGSWLAYACGIMLYAKIFCEYSSNAKKVVAAICISSIVIVNETGALLGMYVEQRVAGFDSAILKGCADLLLIGAAWFLIEHPVWKYYVSENAAFLGELSNGLTTLAIIIYDIFSVNFFGIGLDPNVRLLMAIIFVILYAINNAGYQMIYRLSREQTHVLDLQAQNQMDKSAASLLAVTENNLNELHKINHDIQNQYAYMGMLLKKGSLQALQDYFDELTGTFSEPLVPFVDCGNRVLDLIFNMENAKAKEAGIELDIKAVPPHELPFRDLDLCNLYTNIIDNAIEACVAEKHENAVVHVTVNVRGDYLFTQVANPTKKDKNFLENISTTKGDRRTHGKGMSIVRGIVKRYNGRFASRIENGIFYAEFFIDLTYKREDSDVLQDQSCDL